MADVALGRWFLRFAPLAAAAVATLSLGCASTTKIYVKSTDQTNDKDSCNDQEQQSDRASEYDKRDNGAKDSHQKPTSDAATL